MFIDRITVKFKAGNGGDGHKSFGMNRKPMGGDGGRGGNVYLQGSALKYDLGYIKKDYTYEAGQGVPGGKKNLTGAYGKDLVFEVPLATVVYNSFGEKIMEISKDGEKKELLVGGKGGLGNHHFKSGGFHTLEKTTQAERVDAVGFRLELELESDAILIGYPNAGKSSLLSSLTNAQVKVASYAFTTIDPQLGRMNNIVIMDLPGLIEGTSEGKGLGTRFVKHTRRTELALHCVSFEEGDMFKAYETMRNELEKIDAQLFHKDEIILLTKSDVANIAKIKKVEKEFKKKYKKEVLSVSILDDESLDKLAKLLSVQLNGKSSS